METLNALPDWVSGYRPAIAASMVLCLLVLTQTVLGVIFGIVVGPEEPGGKYKGDYGEFGFRTLRSYSNSTETIAVFAFSLLLAMIAGASPGWVNWLAVLYIVARVFHWVFYYAGLGPNIGGPRTVAFVLGWIINVLLAVIALFALFG
jgi:uncharacterized MAPEG superfamily protein